jgi:peptidoglycan lytic transglycosylase G
MENIYKKIKEDLESLSEEEKNKILKKLREEMDAVDTQIIHQLNKRTVLTVLIGRVKRSLGLPTYSPEREKQIAERISKLAEEPLRPDSLLRIYERILDESRATQREEKNKGNVFRISINNMKSGLKNMFSKRDLMMIIGFFFIILAILYYIFFTPNYYHGKSPKKFEIVKGETLNQVVDSLYIQGIIPNKTKMKIISFVFGSQRQIRAGRFYLPNGLSYVGLLEYLINGKVDYLVDVKLYPGSTIKSLAAQLKYGAFIDSSNFVNACRNKMLIDSLGIKDSTMQGYLLPQKYNVYQRSSAREVLDTLYSGFKKFLTDSLKNRAQELNLSLHDVLTLASIVQGETQKASEMPKIAGVYLNRLKKGMKLQADPTIEYLQNNGSWKRLSYNDLKVDNPYNTYINYGLPPGPINNPGKNAILAVLYPDKDNFLYFVANGNGGHKFSETYTQHLRNVKEYREWLHTQENK